MKSAAVLVFAGLAAAQFSQLPTCAQSCANTYLQKGIGNCGVDAKCICADSDFISGIACCLAQPGGCDAADQSSAVVFASQLCAAQGVTVPTAVSCAATATASDATATGTGTSAAATATATATGTAAATATTDATPASTATGTKTTGTAATAATGTAATTSAATSPATNFAPRESVAAAGLVGGIVAALAML